MFQQTKKTALRFIASAAALGSGLVATSAYAVPPDLTSLTAAVDFSTASAAILLVGGALIIVYITMKAAKMVIGMVRGG
ncbi:MAG: hypothetical protein WBK51_12445 [Polaromonas sp.]